VMLMLGLVLLIFIVMFSFAVATNAVSKERAGVDAIDVGQIFNHDQLMQLKNSLRLPHNEVINLTKIVGDHLFLNIR